MKILYISHTSSDNSGSSKALINIVKGMKQRGVDVAVVCPKKKGSLPDKLRQLNIKVYAPIIIYTCYYVYFPDKNIFSRIKAVIHLFWKEILGEIYLYKIIKEFKPDIVHTNSSACIVGYNVCKRMGVKHVWHVREYLDKGFKWTPFPSASAHFKRMADKFSYKIAITQAISDFYHFQSKDISIYDGVIDTNKYFKVTQVFEYPFFLYVGNITEAKGVECLIEQFLIFYSHEKQHHLVLAGAYNNINFYKRLNRLVEKYQAQDFVHWLGYRDDIYNLMSNATALIVPSYNEGFGFIMAEAMYCGCLVIGRDTAGLKEQFDLGHKVTGSEIGLRFKENSEIVKLMFRAISEDFSNMKSLAKDVVVQNYTLDVNSDRIFNYYKNILSQKNA